MANITPRKNKSGQIISYSVRIYNGRNMYGVQNPPKCMTIRRDAKKYPFNERGDAAFEKYAVKFAAEEEIKRKGIPIIDNKQTYEEYSTEALLNRYAAGNLSRNTYERYLEFQKRIIPIIGSKRMNDIDANDIERVQTQLLSCNSIEKKAQAKSRLDKVIKEGLLQYAAYDELKATVQKKHHSNADGKIPLSVLARAAGVATSTVRKALDGESIEQTSAAKIAKALGYDASQLFEIKDEFKQLSKKTVLEHINVISSVFTKAKKSKIVLFNPVDFIEKVEPEKPNQIFYTPEVINEILEALDAEAIYWKVMGTILIYTGIRRGELLGLSWDDVDFDANTISIHNEILSSNGKMYFKAGTKSNSSERTLLVIPYIIDLLKQYREWRSEHGDNDIEDNEWKQYNLIFINPLTGKPYTPDSVTSFFKSFAAKNNLPHIHPHAFRHSVATTMIESGEDITDVANTLGHEGPAVTKRVYDHTIKKVQKRSTIVLGEKYKIPGQDNNIDK